MWDQGDGRAVIRQLALRHEHWKRRRLRLRGECGSNWLCGSPTRDGSGVGRVSGSPGRCQDGGLQHPQLAVRQLERCVADLALRGVQIGTRARERELDHQAPASFWAAAEEFGALVITHPWGCTLSERLTAHYLTNTVGIPVETAVALSRIVFSGLLDRHPALDICSVHRGGYLPIYPAGRTTRGMCTQRRATANTRPVPTYGGSGSTRWSTPRRGCGHWSTRSEPTGSCSAAAALSIWECC
ncbi:amidohydrolase family protein [Streptomyces sp. DG2A-72]|uniref:amidohydrolase family protein n=1 Tax=Streptomyces sp. DG2A-72 TaxID=3051386 RepID=UPI003463A870